MSLINRSSLARKHSSLFFLFTAFFLGISPCFSKDLGFHGTTFEIAEPCLLRTLQTRLKAYQETGKLDVLQDAFKERVQKSLQRPRPVEGLSKAEEARSRFFDPSITLSEDIKDLHGNILGRKGQVINPLGFSAFGADLLFLDGDDEEQVAWARRQAPESKWILTKGAPFEMQDAEERPVFFDQGGILTRRFGIQALPTRIRQEGKRLVIEEVPCQEESIS